MNPTIWGVIGPGFLKQVPTISTSGVEGQGFWGFRVWVWDPGFWGFRIWVSVRTYDQSSRIVGIDVDDGRVIHFGHVRTWTAGGLPYTISAHHKPDTETIKP